MRGACDPSRGVVIVMGSAKHGTYGPRRVLGPSIAVFAVLGVVAPTTATPPLVIEHEDHHQMPPEYAAPGWSLPPASEIAPEYPLAAAFIPADSSNYTANGMGTVRYVVVHTMQGSYAGSINWFQNPVSDVSAQFCVRSSDGEITQTVQLVDKAWHVGSENPISVGIEHEGYVDDASWYTWAMYRESAKLARWLADHYDLPLDREHIVGHVELPNQTHTDPGPNWNWALYMALVKDVVAADVVEGTVVDPALACTLTASVDTWLKTTLEDAASLPDDGKCFVAAGTALPYLHASDDMAGHRRLIMDDDGPCAGSVLGEEAFVALDHFEGWCAPESLAVPEATLRLDGGEPIAVGPDGGFSIAGVGAGMHTLDAEAVDHAATQVAIDHAGYPGTRVVVRLPSTAAPDPTTGGGSEGGATSGDPTDGGTGLSGSGDDGLADGTGSSGGGDPDDDALPDTFGEQDLGPSGCACQLRATGAPASVAAWAGVLLLGLRRRRGA